nr:immunoglobulin light chain junction region [Macaca mulatta]MOV77760.1 immunoglobulin light chain junction region [Macaca mulatta]MOV78228.1 immunoglobulin light chain junction region [Macaca mulatta]MOV78245.1 immunoglobulin light chain junction region [Macaca mulatta]MOV78438.1 immunoglobulin light chain junction region [Macaca mulatta]
CGQGTHLPLTF